MGQSYRKACIVLIIIGFSYMLVQAQSQPDLSAIPRVDVHCHISSLDLMENYLAVSSILKDTHGVNPHCRVLHVSACVR